VVNTRRQSRFRRFCFDEARLNLHRHRDLSAKRLIVFVHGLNGGGYGTWGKFPRYIFNDQSRDPVDVALFDYFSGLRRRIGKRPPVEVIAQILTERLQDLSNEGYDEIFIIAHSMGGLIATDALRSYIEQRDEEPGLLRVLAGTIFISTPFSGSKFARARIRLLVKEWEHLQLDSPYQQDLGRFNRAKIDTKNKVELGAQRYKVPMWSFVGARDRIVERSSSTYGIDGDQIRTVDEGHRKISKPRRLGSEVVKQARDIVDGISTLRGGIREAEEIARKATRPHTPANLVLVEFFLESDASDDWPLIYESVVQSAGSTLVQVEDQRISNLKYPPNLLISAHRADDLRARRETTKLKLEELRRRYDEGGAHARAIAVGARSESAMSVLSEMTGIAHQDNQLFYQLTFRPADNDEQLSVRLTRCVAEIVRRQHTALTQQDTLLQPGAPLQIVSDGEES
jgi:pimeloyl-ACP methyl ester carboxylesterase